MSQKRHTPTAHAKFGNTKAKVISQTKIVLLVNDMNVINSSKSRIGYRSMPSTDYERIMKKSLLLSFDKRRPSPLWNRKPGRACDAIDFGFLNACPVAKTVMKHY